MSMSDLAGTSLILGMLWVPLLYFGVRRRDRLSCVVVLWAWAVQAVIGIGFVTEGRLLSIPWVLLVVTLLVQRMDRDPTHVLNIANAQVEEARKMAHRQINEAMGKFAQDLFAERERLTALEARVHDERQEAQDARSAVQDNRRDVQDRREERQDDRQDRQDARDDAA